MAFSASQYIGIIVFSMFVGAGLIISQDYPSLAEQNNYFFLVLKQISVVLETIINWLIPWIPLGAVSSLTHSIMTGEITQSGFKEYLYLPITLLVTLVVYFLFVVCSGSYVATIPVMMRSIESSRQVSRTLAQFTVTIGTAVSLCGTAAYYVVSCIYMAYASGIEHKLTPGRVIVLMILSTITSFGAPRMGMPRLTYIATIWTTTFGGKVPDSFPLLLSVEWLTLRMRRLVNVAVVAIVARIIAEQLDESAEDEEEREREFEGRDSLDNGSDIAPL
ncbi:hypothetical protein Poli38472_012997 [Pythium oligandrum]|uniref:Amino acid transporter n=1 Tax=Pythium oligandrum TaxID=41045 RepID=A0A8K1CJG6_PYTOL|nr:hypothetical protein Poli38472_012997 [Pythium oligandrum]|eukprot:TMW64375.1 hypothetical protein Poli38472_012997 [Pythium oligandrum]